MNKNKKRHENHGNLVEDDIVEDADQQDWPLERRYPGPHRLPTKIDWDRLGPAAVGTSSSNRRRSQRRLISISNETRERIIQDLRSRGIID